ncbi:hypothetical protein C7A10_29660 [Pseudomonas fluorescens]|jgi:hypothetical protein|uniref:Uncharacterized protein n=1 Tax=Pseudomonas fluorescens TaxID=294 RepID=A0A2T0HLR6_PSEFL|nr:hypothetical protein C7A10_29660 [Pseudomonas fluorescens]
MSASVKPRGPQAKPTRAELNSAWARLRSAADKGSVEACALLIALSENKPVISLESHLARA